MRDYLFQRTRGLDAYATKETHAVYADQKKVRLEAAIMSWSNLIKAGKNQKAIEEGTERIKVLQKLLEEISPGSSNNQK